jgi:hypothetical protein
MDAIDEDLASRKRSLTSLKFAFENARTHEKDVIGHGAICLLYAHWEGFVKFSGMCFTNYVSRLGLTYQQLSNGMVAACLRSQIKGLRTTNKIGLNREFVELLRDRSLEKPAIPWQSAIDTYDNLNSEVLFEILAIVGCDAAPYETRIAFIDEKLLRHRNRIAHNGHVHDFDVSEFPSIHLGVLALLEQVRDDIQNAAHQRRFEKPMASCVGC